MTEVVAQDDTVTSGGTSVGNHNRSSVAAVDAIF